MTDIRVRSDKPQTDSFGNEWKRKGQIVAVPADQAAALLAVPDGGFAAVGDNDIEPVVVASGLAPVEQPNASAYAVTDHGDGVALIAAGAVATDADRPPHATVTNSGVPVRPPVFVQTSPAGEVPAATDVPAGERKSHPAKGDGPAKSHRTKG